jgi:hypothetical protein
MGVGIVGLLVLAGIVLGITAVVQRAMKKGEGTGTGADIVPYLVLALSMGVAGFALAELASTAFPGDRFVFDPAESVATSLAALVVSVPFLIFFWRRQADRRTRYPRSPGWTLYLTIIQLVFLTAFTVAAVLYLNGLLGPDPATAWTGLVVFGAIVVFHDLAARRTPPQSDAHDLPRVAGSAIGLITALIGVTGTLAALFDLVLDTMGLEFEPFLAMAIVGVPIWAYNWFRRWDGEVGVPRLTWTVIVSVGSAVMALTGLAALLLLVLQYLLASTAAARLHFETTPMWLAALISGAVVWAIHRRALGTERRNSVRAYEYAMAAIGLATAITTAISLTLIALDRSLIVGGGTADVIGVAVPLVVGLVVWRWFTTRSWTGEPEEEAVAWPRRFYHLGVGVVLALIAAGSLITAIFILLRRVLGEDGSGSFLEPVTILVYTGLGAWYLLAAYTRDRESDADETVVSPFDVTVVCSHPGPLATKFPKQARLKVIHRGDDVGPIDEEMATAIVNEVANRPSIVWVDEDGFRVAPLRT